MKSDFMVKNVNFHRRLNLFKWQAVYLYWKLYKQINLFTDIKKENILYSKAFQFFKLKMSSDG